MFEDAEKIRMGPGSHRNSTAHIVLNHSGNNSTGIGSDIAATSHPVSERAGHVMGDYFVGQDTQQSGTKDFGIVDGSGNLILSLAPTLGSEYTLAQSAAAVAGPVDTTEDVVKTISLAAGQMGKNGLILLSLILSCTNSATVKTVRIRLGGIGGTVLATIVLTSLSGGRGSYTLQNRNLQNSQLFDGIFTTDTPSQALTSRVPSAIDTSAATTLVVTIQKATGSDTVTVESFNGQLIPAF